MFRHRRKFAGDELGALDAMKPAQLDQTVNIADARDLIAFDDWANARLFDCVMSLEQDAFLRHFGGSFPTIRDAMAHVIGAEWVWLQRWCGNNPSSPPSWYASDDRALLMSEYRSVVDGRKAWIDGLTDEELDRSLPYTLMSGKPGVNRVGDLIFHMVNHSTYHRGQIVAMLRQAGATPPGTDFIVFRAEHPER